MIAQTAGISLKRTRNEDDRPEEWIPGQDASVLYTWTGIKADKSEHETQFPRYLRFAERDIVTEFAQIHVQRHTVEREDTTDERIQIMEQRTSHFRESLVGLLERVADGEDAIQGDSWPIYIIGDSAIQRLTVPRINEIH